MKKLVILLVMCSSAWGWSWNTPLCLQIFGQGPLGRGDFYSEDVRVDSIKRVSNYKDLTRQELSQLKHFVWELSFLNLDEYFQYVDEPIRVVKIFNFVDGIKYTLFRSLMSNIDVSGIFLGATTQIVAQTGGGECYQDEHI